MIKIVSLIVFIAAFIFSWQAFNGKSDMGIDVHAGIQSQLTLLIEDTIKSKRPGSDNFKLIKMYTQKIDDLKVMAYFSYEFNDHMPSADLADKEQTTQKVSGTALLSKGLSEDPLVQKWILQSVKTDKETVDFKEGITIISDGKPSEAPTSENK